MKHSFRSRPHTPSHSFSKTDFVGIEHTSQNTCQDSPALQSDRHVSGGKVCARRIRLVHLSRPLSYKSISCLSRESHSQRLIYKEAHVSKLLVSLVYDARMLRKLRPLQGDKPRNGPNMPESTSLLQYQCRFQMLKPTSLDQ